MASSRDIDDKNLFKTRSGRCVKFNNASLIENNVLKRKKKLITNRLKEILKKAENERNDDDINYLNNHKSIIKKLEDANRSKMNQYLHQSIVIDDDVTIDQKCQQLANAIYQAKHLVVYTGAGISTSSSIPDYRGPNGVWTLLKKGIKPDNIPDFAQCKPTYTHMILKELLNRNIIKHLVSQNCDGLHLRSGIDRNKLSEIHGNCFIEYCNKCKKEYLRLFDVTENSKYRHHKTTRLCSTCKCELHDTIIHIGEKSNLTINLPYNWYEAEKQVQNTDMILCIGTSLNILKHYKCLWPKNISKKNSNLYIVNIQWTCKDNMSKLKLNHYCDYVFEKVCFYLNKNFNIDLNCDANNKSCIEYCLQNDPLLHLATPLTDTNEINRLKNSNINSESCQDVDGNKVIMENTSSWISKCFKKK